MSFERYIELLQQLITMVDPNNEEQVLNGKNVLKNILELAQSSRMVDGLSLRGMHAGYQYFSMLLHRKNDFAGKPGDIEGNQAKRQRLVLMLRPGC